MKTDNSAKEREMIREAAIKTAHKVIQPRAAEIDSTGQFPSELVEAFGRQGLLSILLPEEYGGTNGDLLAFCSVVEEVAKVSGTSAMFILAQGIATIPILASDNTSLQEKYFNRIADSNSLVALVLSDGRTPYDAGSIGKVAEKMGDNYRINGTERFVANAGIAEVYTVFASIAPGHGPESISGFVVEKGARGLSFGQNEELVGMKGAVIADVVFDGCQVPETNLLNQEGKGWDLARRTLIQARPACGALALGIAQGAVEFAIQYAKERVQFGKPIISFQAMQFMVADMLTQVEAARALVYEAVERISRDTEGLQYYSSTAKSFASEVAVRVTTDAVQILGGYGYMKDYPVERMMRDARVAQIYGGSSIVQRDIVAADLFGD